MVGEASEKQKEISGVDVEEGDDVSVDLTGL
jgi:hypothetical protein